MPNIYRTISIRQLVVTPGWTVFHLPSTPRVVVLPDTVAFRPFSARSPLLPHAGVLLKVRHRLARRRPSATAARQPETCALCAAVSSDAVRHGDELGTRPVTRRLRSATTDLAAAVGVASPLGCGPGHSPQEDAARVPVAVSAGAGCSTAPRRTPSGVLDARAVLISGAR